jgi:epoxyqueuosine reductase
MKTSIFQHIRLPWRADAKLTPAARRQLAREVVDKALAIGVSLAGIADCKALRASPSHRAETVRWPSDARSAIVLALSHPASDSRLDHWNGEPGGTPGNRRLTRAGLTLVRWLKRRHGIEALSVPYPIQRGGVFFKDAAVLAGLGIIGRNNLVVTPTLGPRIRLRVILLNTRLTPTGPLADFNPCDPCSAPCLYACPQGAFRSGSFDRRCCLCQMARDESVAVPDDGIAIQYCRVCELACPLGD